MSAPDTFPVRVGCAYLSTDRSFKVATLCAIEEFDGDEARRDIELVQMHKFDRIAFRHALNYAFAGRDAPGAALAAAHASWATRDSPTARQDAWRELGSAVIGNRVSSPASLPVLLKFLEAHGQDCIVSGARAIAGGLHEDAKRMWVHRTGEDPIFETPSAPIVEDATVEHARRVVLMYADILKRRAPPGTTGLMTCGHVLFHGDVLGETLPMLRLVRAREDTDEAKRLRSRFASLFEAFSVLVWAYPLIHRGLTGDSEATRERDAALADSGLLAASGEAVHIDAELEVLGAIRRLCLALCSRVFERALIVSQGKDLWKELKAWDEDTGTMSPENVALVRRNLGVETEDEFFDSRGTIGQIQGMARIQSFTVRSHAPGVFSSPCVLPFIAVLRMARFMPVASSFVVAMLEMKARDLLTEPMCALALNLCAVQAVSVCPSVLHKHHAQFKRFMDAPLARDGDEGEALPGIPTDVIARVGTWHARRAVEHGMHVQRSELDFPSSRSIDPLPVMHDNMSFLLDAGIACATPLRGMRGDNPETGAFCERTVAARAERERRDAERAERQARGEHVVIPPFEDAFELYHYEEPRETHNVHARFALPMRMAATAIATAMSCSNAAFESNAQVALRSGTADGMVSLAQRALVAQGDAILGKNPMFSLEWHNFPALLATEHELFRPLLGAPTFEFASVDLCARFGGLVVSERATRANPKRASDRGTKSLASLRIGAGYLDADMCDMIEGDCEAPARREREEPMPEITHHPQNLAWRTIDDLERDAKWLQDNAHLISQSPAMVTPKPERGRRTPKPRAARSRPPPSAIVFANKSAPSEDDEGPASEASRSLKHVHDEGGATAPVVLRSTLDRDNLLRFREIAVRCGAFTKPEACFFVFVPPPSADTWAANVGTMLVSFEERPIAHPAIVLASIMSTSQFAVDTWYALVLRGFDIKPDTLHFEDSFALPIVHPSSAVDGATHAHMNALLEHITGRAVNFRGGLLAQLEGLEESAMDRAVSSCAFALAVSLAAQCVSPLKDPSSQPVLFVHAPAALFAQRLGPVCLPVVARNWRAMLNKMDATVFDHTAAVRDAMGANMRAHARELLLHEETVERILRRARAAHGIGWLEDLWSTCRRVM